MNREWLCVERDGSIVLALHVQPGAARTEFVGLHGDAIKLRLSAPPVDGKANAALCAFLAKFCDVPRAAVDLVGGAASRAKRVRIIGCSSEAVARLRALAGCTAQG